MGDGFSNPVTNAIGTLVRRALQSVNFVTGLSGWQVTRDGDAEFNDATFRGQINLGFSPNPRLALGPDIPASLATFSADFVFSEAIIEYFSATDYYFDAVGTYVGVSGPFSIRMTGHYTTTFGMIVHEINQGVGGGPTLILYGSDTYSQPIGWLWRNGSVQFTSTVLVLASNIFYEDSPGGFGDQTWTDMTLLNGWTGRASIRRVASPPNEIQIRFACTAGTKVDGTNLFVLPVGFRPTTGQDLVMNAFGGAISGSQPPHLNILSSGNVQLYGINTSTNIGGSGSFSLDW